MEINFKQQQRKIEKVKIELTCFILSATNTIYNEKYYYPDQRDR